MKIFPSDPDTDQDIDRLIAEQKARERKATRDGAHAFIDACRSGDVESFRQAVHFIADNTLDGWRLALKRVSGLREVQPDIREAFIPVWTEHKGMSSWVDRATLVKALKLLLPPNSNADGKPRTVFRGATALERRRHAYGISWTSDRSVADDFAQNSSHHPSGGVVLTTTVEPDAILYEPDHYDESELIVDPYKLGRVTVVARYPSTSVSRVPTISVQEIEAE